MKKTLRKLLCLVVMTMACGSAWADIASGTSGNCTWVISDAGVLTVSPMADTDGKMGTWGSNTGNKDYEKVPWYNYRNNIKSATISSGVKLQTCAFLFYTCANLTDFSIDSHSTDEVTCMISMFDKCENLTSISASQLNFNTSNVTTMVSMFNGCQRLETVDLQHLNTAKVTTMAAMFYGCSSLKHLDLKSFDTSNLSNILCMFYNCNELKTIDMSSFNFDALQTAYNTNSDVIKNALYHDDNSTIFKSTLSAIYLPDNTQYISLFNAILATKKDGELCAVYFPTSSKSKYESLDVLGTDYPYTLGQYILAGDITDNYTRVDPGIDVGNAAHTFDVAEIRYFRKVKNYWGTLILPWRIKTSTSYTLHKAVRIENKNLVVTDVLTSIVPNTPCVFHANRTGSLIFYNFYSLTRETNDLPSTTSNLLPTSQGDCKIEGTGDNNLIVIGKYATVNKIPAVSSDYYYYYYENDKFWRATGTLTVPIFRAYLAVPKTATATSDGQAASAKSLNIVIDDGDMDEATGIDELTNTNQSASSTQMIYNLAGQRLDAPVKGQINIINGKKVVVE